MRIPYLLPIVFAALPGCLLAGAEPETPCSDTWNHYVERKVITADGQGHGPDIGSDEWKGTVEFKLGIRGQPGLPARGSKDWCRLIDKLVHERY